MRDDKQSEPEDTGDIRNEKGQFVPGVSGNPNGRPAGSLSIVEAIRSKLKEVPEGEQRTYLDKFLTRLFEEAIEKGNDKLLRDMIDRVDGKPMQRNEFSGEINTKAELTDEQFNRLIRQRAEELGSSEGSAGTL